MVIVIVPLHRRASRMFNNKNNNNIINMKGFKGDTQYWGKARHKGWNALFVHFQIVMMQFAILKIGCLNIFYSEGFQILEFTS